MTPANEHNHNATAMTVLRGRNIQVRQVGSKIRVIGAVKEAEDMRARHRASAAITATEICLSCLVVFVAVYLGLGAI